jgi:spore coat polysaccharide biosynthesis protein SpsF
VNAWIVVQARMSSTRFPGKVLADLHGAPLIVRLLERLAQVEQTGVVVATTTETDDDPLAETVARAGVKVVRGSLDDVLGRFAAAAATVGADPVVRITADCPLADPGLIDAMLARWRELDGTADLLTNVSPPTYPDGLDVEIVSRAALERANAECNDAFEREHVTRHLHQRPEDYRHVAWTTEPDRSGERWTVDYPQDLDFVRAVYAELYPALGPAFRQREIDHLLSNRPDIAALQADVLRNEALQPPD